MSVAEKYQMADTIVESCNNVMRRTLVEIANELVNDNTEDLKKREFDNLISKILQKLHLKENTSEN